MHFHIFHQFHQQLTCARRQFFHSSIFFYKNISLVFLCNLYNFLAHSTGIIVGVFMLDCHSSIPCDFPFFQLYLLSHPGYTAIFSPNIQSIVTRTFACARIRRVTGVAARFRSSTSVSEWQDSHRPQEFGSGILGNQVHNTFLP